MSRRNSYVLAALDIANGRARMLSRKAYQPVTRKIAGERVRIAPMASMGAELLGAGVLSRTEAVDRMLELAGKRR